MSGEREHLGVLVKNLEPLHYAEYKVIFNLHENTFFQKLVSKDVIDKIRVRPEEYFKALLFLDYFSRTLVDNYSVCDNLENLSKAIRDKEREAGIDNGDNGASYLSLEAVVIETGLWIKEKQIETNRKSLTKEQIRETIKRYRQEETINFSSPDIRKSDLFYEAIGELICSQVNEPMKKYLGTVSSRAELGAVIFSDYSLKYLPNAKIEENIHAKFSKGDYLVGSLIALEHLAEQSSLDKLTSLIKLNFKN